MKIPIKFKRMRLVAVLIVLCSLLPWQYVLSITSAQQSDNSSVISMQQLNETSTTATWKTTYNENSAYTGNVVVSINAGNAQLDSLYLLNSSGNRESLGYVTSKSQFQQIISDYRTYIASKQTYTKEYESYVSGLAGVEASLNEANAAYTNNVGTLETSLAGYQSQLTTNANDIASLEASNIELSSYIVAVDEETSEEVVAANTQYEAQIVSQQAQIQAIQANNNEVEAAISSTNQQLASLSEALALAQSEFDNFKASAPTDPYNDYMENSWKVMLQSDTSKEVYQVYVPKDFQAYSFEWSVSFNEYHDALNVSSAVNLNSTTYRATDQIEAVEAEPGEESSDEAATSSESEESSSIEETDQASESKSVDSEVEEDSDEGPEENSEKTEEETSDEEISDESGESDETLEETTEEETSEDSDEETSDETEESSDETRNHYLLHVWNGSEFIAEIEVEKETVLDSAQLDALTGQLQADFLYWQSVPLATSDETEEAETVLDVHIPPLEDYVTLDAITWTEDKDVLQDPRQPLDLTQPITSDAILLPVYASDYAKVQFKLDDVSTLQTIFIRPGVTIPSDLIPYPNLNTNTVARMATSTNTVARMATSTNTFLYWTTEQVTDAIVPPTIGEEQGDLENTSDPRNEYNFSEAVVGDTDLEAVWENDYHLLSFETQVEDLEMDPVFVADQEEVSEEYLAELTVESENRAFEYWADSEGVYAPFEMYANETDPGSAYKIYGPNGNYGDEVTSLTVSEDATLYAVWDNPDKSIPSTLAAIPGSVAQDLTTSPSDYLEVNKTATPVEGTVNTWDILLEIEGQKTEKVADIVLVIDRSGSMYGTKMSNAISAAKEFVDKFAGEGKVRIGIVSFASDPSADLGLTPATQAQTIKDKISFTAVGGTHTQGAIYTATQMLDQSTDKAPQQYIVLLSDGDPTYSYGVTYDQNNIISNSSPFSNRRYVTDKAYALSLETNYNSTIGPGNSDYAELFSVGYFFRDTYYIRNSHRAIREGSIAKGKGYNIFTIGFEISAGSAADVTMAEVATSANHYKTASSANISAIFDHISDEIIRNLGAATNMVVTDLMGEGFSIQAVSSINPSQGTPSYDPNTHTLTWTAGELNEPKTTADSRVKYASMTYRLELDPSMLLVDGFDTTKWFAANESAVLTHDGTPLTFPVPVIDPLLIHFKKDLYSILGEVLDEDAREFSVTFADGLGNTETVVLTSGADPVYLTTLRTTGNYTVTEILADGEAVNLDFYDISIVVDAVEKQGATATVNVTGVYEEVTGTDGRVDYDNTQADIEVVIKNKEKPFALDILKVDGTDVENVLADASFELRLTPDGEAAKDINGNDLVGTTNGNGLINFTGIAAGTYYLVETQTPPGYTIFMEPVQVNIDRHSYLDVTTLLVAPIPNGVSVNEGKDYIPIITVENMLTGTFPNTGGWGDRWLYGLGINLVLLAVAGIWTLESRRGS